MSTASITQQQRAAADSPARRRIRTNPWQRVLALIALVPAVIGLGAYVAFLGNHNGDGTAIVELYLALYALAVAGSFALLWLLVGAINWQIKEAARSRG